MRTVRALLGLVVLLVAGAPSVTLPSAHAMDGGRLGGVQITSPTGQMQDLVVLLSDRDGWTQADVDAATVLAAKGAVVVGVDTSAYLKRLDAVDETCHHLVGDVEAISRQLQRERETATYHTPIVSGVGEGGTLAERILAQAPPNTIAGAISLDPSADVALRAPPCTEEPVGHGDNARDRAAGRQLQGFLTVGITPSLPGRARESLTHLRADGIAMTLLDLPANEVEAKYFLTLTEGRLSGGGEGVDDVSGLPLIELPASKPSDLLAVVMSGDGGWRDLDKTIAEDLRNRGVSVVGWDSLRYFWSAKTPDEAAADLSKVLRVYVKRWHATNVALIAYSFGADILPFAYNRLPESLRAKVSLLSLLGLADAADFEIRVTGWLGIPPSKSAVPVLPEIARVPASLVQCYYGVDEDDTVCPQLADRGVAVIRTGGGHHFDGNYEAIAQQILSGWQQRISRSQGS